MYRRPLRSDELYHFGILGMHWGIRRFQNEDGTWKNKKAKERHTDQQEKSENRTISKSKVQNKPASNQSTLSTKPDENNTVNPDHENVKRTIKNGAIIAGGIIAVVGAATVVSQVRKNKITFDGAQETAQHFKDAIPVRKDQVSRALSKTKTAYNKSSKDIQNAVEKTKNDYDKMKNEISGHTSNIKNSIDKLAKKAAETETTADHASEAVDDYTQYLLKKKR